MIYFTVNQIKTLIFLVRRCLICSIINNILQIELDTDRDNFMNAWEAKEYGLVDAVIDDGKPGLVAPIGDASPPPKTRVWDLWKVEGSRKARKNLPSEEKFLLSVGNDSDDRGPEQKDEASRPE